MFAALVISALLGQAAPDLTVYVFTTTDCPISNRYAPEIQRLAKKFDSKARFILVYPVPSDSQSMIREHQQKFGYALESIRDTGQKLLKQFGVTVTPEVAVTKAGQLVYRGRIDDRYVELGRERPAPTNRDLENALDMLIAGKSLAVRETQAVGCILADLVK
jgi:thiol-disulfide isomerase/thioredoxin